MNASGRGRTAKQSATRADGNAKNKTRRGDPRIQKMHTPKSETTQLVSLALGILNLAAPAINKQNNLDAVSFQQKLLLVHIGRSREMTMTDIARWCGHSTAAATGSIDRLEKLGYVQRAHAIDDRRKVLVRLTPKGSDLVRDLSAGIARELQQAFDYAEIREIPQRLDELATLVRALSNGRDVVAA